MSKDPIRPLFPTHCSRKQIVIAPATANVSLHPLRLPHGMKSHLSITREIQKRLEIRGPVVSAPVLRSFFVVAVKHPGSPARSDSDKRGCRTSRVKACSPLQSPKPSPPWGLTAANKDLFCTISNKTASVLITNFLPTSQDQNETNTEIWDTSTQLMVIPSLPALEEVKYIQVFETTLQFLWFWHTADPSARHKPRISVSRVGAVSFIMRLFGAQLHPHRAPASLVVS